MGPERKKADEPVGGLVLMDAWREEDRGGRHQPVDNSSSSSNNNNNYSPESWLQDKTMVCRILKSPTCDGMEPGA